MRWQIDLCCTTWEDREFRESLTVEADDISQVADQIPGALLPKLDPDEVQSLSATFVGIKS